MPRRCSTDAFLMGRSVVGVLAALVGAGALIFALAAIRHDGQDDFLTDPPDFRAFYCAGAALDADGDPYRVEPVRSCQHAVLAASHLVLDEHHVLIAPLPPCALVLFGLFARLPFWVAARLWLVLCLAALTVTMLLTRRLTGLPLPVVAVALLGSLGVASLVLGQLVPIVAAALVIAAFAARRGAGRLAGAAAGCLALEPHVALPVWLGLSVLAPRARLPLAGAAGVLVVMSLAFGVQLNLEYLYSVVPAHARSEIMNFPAQYSLSSLLWRLGVGIPRALALGAASYGAMLIVGVAIAAALMRRTRDASFAVLVPVSVALIGGPFVHAHQMALALPCALLLWTCAPPRSLARTLAIAAVVALAIPWETLAESSLVADRFTARAVRPPIALRLPTPNEPIEQSYTAFIDANANRADLRTPFEQAVWKFPTWLALLAVPAAGMLVTRMPQAKRI